MISALLFLLFLIIRNIIYKSDLPHVDFFVLNKPLEIFSKDLIGEFAFVFFVEDSMLFGQILQRMNDWIALDIS